MLTLLLLLSVVRCCFYRLQWECFHCIYLLRFTSVFWHVYCSHFLWQIKDIDRHISFQYNAGYLWAQLYFENVCSEANLFAAIWSYRTKVHMKLQCIPCRPHTNPSIPSNPLQFNPLPTTRPLPGLSAKGKPFQFYTDLINTDLNNNENIFVGMPWNENFVSSPANMKWNQHHHHHPPAGPQKVDDIVWRHTGNRFWIFRGIITI